jgi:hypothetical protein
MNPRRTVILFLALSTLLVGTCGTAVAGIEPSPWHTLISNRTDRLDPSSAFHNQNMFGMALLVRVPSDVVGAGGTREIEIPIRNESGGDLNLASGETLVFAVDPAKFGLSASTQILSWSFFARMGIEPSPWRPVFAFQTKLADLPDPYQPPALAPSYLTGEMPILGFASPGVLVGTVQLVNDDRFYDVCPSIPPVGSWNNHGQYVRCIAHRAEYLVFTGRITQQEADAIVSAAARSETGK